MKKGKKIKKRTKEMRMGKLKENQMVTWCRSRCAINQFLVYSSLLPLFVWLWFYIHYVCVLENFLSAYFHKFNWIEFRSVLFLFCASLFFAFWSNFQFLLISKQLRKHISPSKVLVELSNPFFDEEKKKYTQRESSGSVRLYRATKRNLFHMYKYVSCRRTVRI